MPLLAASREEYAAERPFAGAAVGMCLHVEPKTAVLVEVLLAGGCRDRAHREPGDDRRRQAAVARPRSTASRVWAANADDERRTRRTSSAILGSRPRSAARQRRRPDRRHRRRARLPVTAATEETTSGANRLKAELSRARPVAGRRDRRPPAQALDREHATGSARPWSRLHARDEPARRGDDVLRRRLRRVRPRRRTGAPRADGGRARSSSAIRCGRSRRRSTACASAICTSALPTPTW